MAHIKLDYSILINNSIPNINFFITENKWGGAGAILRKDNSRLKQNIWIKSTIIYFILNEWSK